MLYVGICGSMGDTPKIARELASSAGVSDRVSLYLIGTHFRCLARGRSSVAFAPALAALNSTIVGLPTLRSVSEVRTDILSTLGETGIGTIRVIAGGNSAERAVIEAALGDLTTSWTWIPADQKGESLGASASRAAVLANPVPSRPKVGTPASSTDRKSGSAPSPSGSAPATAAPGTASTSAADPEDSEFSLRHGSFGVVSTMAALFLIMGQSGIGLKWAFVASIIVGAILGRADGRIVRRQRATFTDLVASVVAVAGAWLFFTRVLPPGSVGQWPVTSFLVLTVAFVLLFGIRFVRIFAIESAPLS